MRWADVWTRAVIVPAWRRAAAVWVGCAIVAAVIFGPTGMLPSDVTRLALHHAPIAAVFGATWLLIFAPIARLIVRADAAAYLRSLPNPRLFPLIIGGGALIALQLPWLALWLLGEGARGLLVVGAGTAITVALASWRPPPMRAGWPAWRRPSPALRSIHLRALRRRAGDALLRGGGLAILAGASAGFMIHNNQLTGARAAALGAAAIAVVLVPAYVGVLMVILQTHRQTGWLAASLGIAPQTRTAALVYTVGVIQLAATSLALGAAAVIADTTVSTLAALAATSLAISAGSTLSCSRILLASEDSPTIAARTVVGAIVVASLAVLTLGLLGPAAGAVAFIATGLLAIATVPR